MQMDNIYSEESIYKALIVCHDDEVFDDLFKELETDDYPLCDIHKVNLFRNDVKRLLMIDYIDFNNIDKLLSKKDIDKVTTVFMIEYHGIKNKLPKINNPDINYYIIH